MSDPGIGRVLVASLHQSIADLLPLRLDFYEGWFSPAGLRQGSMGLAPFNAVLSFLRREGDGDAYAAVTERAGTLAASWSVTELPAVQRRLIRGMPDALRARLALGVARRLVPRTFAPSRATVRMQRRGATIDLVGSLFCAVRAPAGQPLCGFYAAAFRQVLGELGVAAHVTVATCRGNGDTGCRLVVTLEASS